MKNKFKKADAQGNRLPEEIGKGSAEASSTRSEQNYF